jgi:hypothetical protein
MPKKFQTYKCSTCKRQADKEFDPLHPFISKCDITYGCTGTLKNVGEKDIGDLNATYQYGVENWRPRNQKIFYTPLKADETFIPIKSYENGEFVLGIETRLLKIDPNDSNSEYYDEVELKVIQLTDKTQIFTEYLYQYADANPAGFIVRGPDVNSATLRLTAENEVIVFKNGERLVEGELADFVTSITDTSLPANSIKLIDPTNTYCSISIISRKKADAKEVTLKFSATQLLANIEEGTWSNVKSVDVCINLENGTIEERNFTLFKLNNVAELGFDVRIQANIKEYDNSLTLKKDGYQDGIQSITGFYQNISNFDSIIGLFSKAQFTCRDRVLTNYFNFSDLRGTSGFIKFSKVAGIYEWQISKQLTRECQYLIEVNDFIVVNNVELTDEYILNSESLEYTNTQPITSDKIINP